MMGMGPSAGDQLSDSLRVGASARWALASLVNKHVDNEELRTVLQDLQTSIGSSPYIEIISFSLLHTHTHTLSLSLSLSLSPLPCIFPKPIDFPCHLFFKSVFSLR